MNKAVLVGWDGATFTVLDPLMEEGVMPFLKGFVARGTRGELLSPPNHITPSSWTSLATGHLPGNHGIFDFIRPQETEDGVYIKLLDARDVRSETIWSMATRQQRRVICLNFPLMFPPQPLAGYMVSGFVPWRHLRRAVYPLDLYERLRTLPGFDARQIAWDLDMEKKAIQALPHDEYEGWIRFHISMEQQWFEILRYLMQTDPCDLTAVLFSGVDKLQHLAWRFIDPALFPKRPSAWEAKIRNLCLDYFRQLDGFLAQIVQIAGEDARVFIVSDHGFGPTWDIFYLNVWLHQHGYLHWGEDGAPLDDGEKVLAMRMKTQYGLLDWKRTAAYALTPSCNGIYIRVSKGPGHPGIRREAYESFRSELIASLLAFTDPESSESIVKHVRTREEIFSGSQLHLAPDLTLELRDQGFISILNADSPLKRRKEPKGMHRPEGILIAAGQGIRQGLTVRQLTVPDVCPALLYSLGLEIPQGLDGRFPAEIFESAFLKTHPARIGESTTPVARGPTPSTEASLPTEGEEAVLARLRNLGYIE
jgi:predicted AlkP superfamily phosphohydrolase/phosphomutase